MWSVGVLLYVMLAGKLPFTSSELSQQIMNAEVTFLDPIWRGVSDMAKDLISKLIVRDPKKRLTAVQALHHPWLFTVCIVMMNDE